MAVSRYNFVKKITFNGKTIYGTSTNSAKINNAVENNRISYDTYILKEGDRLDSIAGIFYGDSNYWWVIAAASGIGWPLQVPPGTFLKITKNLNEVYGIILWVKIILLIIQLLEWIH